MFNRFKGLLSSIFVTKPNNNVIPLQAIGTALFDDTNILPNSLIDPIDYEVLTEPQMTPSGHLYSRRTLDTLLRQANKKGNAVCPLSNQAITRDSIRPAPQEMAALIDSFTKTRAKMLDDINKSKANEKQNRIEIYENVLRQYGARSDGIREKLIQDSLIQSIKNNLKIDSTNPQHMAYWSAKGKNSRQVPDHIAKMMQVAANNYQNVDVFIHAINQARKMSFCCRFFKSAWRDAQTAAVYSASNLRTFRVN